MVRRTWLSLLAWGGILATSGGAWAQPTASPKPAPTPSLAPPSQAHGSNASSGIGELAVFVKTQAFSPTGHPLYAILPTAEHGASAHEVANQATWARFSPDGKWLAVIEAGPPRANATQAESLWLMRSDGSHKTRVSGVGITDGDWIPHTDQYVFVSSDTESLQVVRPGDRPQPFPVKVPVDGRLRRISFSPDGRYLAMVVTFREGTSNAYDQLLLCNLNTGSQRTLLRTTAPEGIILGPWAADGKSVFWWPNPEHSASLAADGLTLTQTDLHGRSHRMATTLVDTGVLYPQLIYHTVVPFGAGDAVVQVGGYREVFRNKRVGLYQAGRLQMLPNQPGKVQLSPDTNGDGSIVAFTAAPELSGYWGSDARFQTWVNQFNLYVYDVRTRQLKQVTAAGKGVQTPLLTADGKNILFIRQNHVMEIPSDGHGHPATVSTLPKGLLQVADYWP